MSDLTRAGVEMRRTVTVALSLILLASLSVDAAAEAQKKKKKNPRRERTVEMAYTEPAIGTAGIGICFQGSSCAFTEPARGERFVHVAIEDELGLPVYASIIQDTSGDGNYLATEDETVHICGETEEPIEIQPRMTVTVWVWRGPGATPPCPGMASAGTITATFSNRP